MGDQRDRQIGLLSVSTTAIAIVYLLVGAFVFSRVTADLVNWQCTHIGPGFCVSDSIPLFSRLVLWCCYYKVLWLLALGLSAALVFKERKIADRLVTTLINLAVAAALPLVGLLVSWALGTAVWDIVARLLQRMS